MRVRVALHYRLVVLIPFLLFSQLANATVYSSAESGTDGWVVSDNTPAGATIESVVDADQGSRVIQTSGAGRSNGYLLGGTSASTGWNNSNEFQMSWEMATTRLV